MIKWITTGFRIFWQWKLAVGLWESLHGCAWVIVRKALPRQKTLAKAIMPRLRVVEIRVPGYQSPLYARWPASDLHILYTIITCKEYAPMIELLNGAEEVALLDIGANIGMASRYLLEAFPNARVVAVEPDPGNVQMCRKNLECYGSRAQVIEAAAWNRNTSLVFEEETTQIGLEAGVRVRPLGSGETSIPSIIGLDIPTLLSKAGAAPGIQIAIKIDAEGSEEDIFQGHDLPWLNDVSCIAIELHDSVRENCSRNFFAAVKSHLAEPPRKISDTVFVRLKNKEI
ncbi:MAG TPA: FkbM family methyltransferase [Bryobacteraceae bacterium]